MQQRWVRLPNGAVVNANAIVYISKPESYSRTDDEGNLVGEYAVTIGTDIVGPRHLSVSGSKEEIATLVKNIAGIS